MSYIPHIYIYTNTQNIYISHRSVCICVCVCGEKQILRRWLSPSWGWPVRTPQSGPAAGPSGESGCCSLEPQIYRLGTQVFYVAVLRQNCFFRKPPSLLLRPSSDWRRPATSRRVICFTQSLPV